MGYSVKTKDIIYNKLSSARQSRVPATVRACKQGWFGGEKAIKNDQKSIKNRPKITQNRTPKEVWAALGAYRGVLVVSWGFLKAFWGVPGTSWSLLGSVLAASWGHPGGLLEGLAAPLGASWGLPVRPGSLLGLIF